MISANINIVLGVALAALLIFAAITDVKTKYIPDWICVTVCIPVASRIIWGGLSPLNALSGLLVAGLPLLIMAYVKRGSVGGGDVKLAAATGLFLGLEGAPSMLFLSCLFFYVDSYRMQKKGKVTKGSSTAFAPYIAASAILTFTLMLMGG